jgi:hypothetical protein
MVKQEEQEQANESIKETRRTESSVKDEKHSNSDSDLSVLIKGEEEEDDGGDGDGGDDDGREDQNGDDEDEDDDEFYRPPEPRYDKANSLNFRQLCQRFETLWKQKSKKKKPSKDEILEFLLPRSLQKFIHGDGDFGQDQGVEPPNNNAVQITTSANQQQSIFPLLRLICPDKDTTRARLYMKEAVIAKTWAEALGLSKKSSDYNKLIHYNDPTVAGMSAAGDISMCVYEVVKKRYPEFDDKRRHGGVTVEKMNELLDELAGVRTVDQDQEPLIRESPLAQLSAVPKVGSHGLQTKRKAWVKKLLNMKFSVSECFSTCAKRQEHPSITYCILLLCLYSM